MSFIAGIGSREIPGKHSSLMLQIGLVCSLWDNIGLRSGCADGSDNLFEHGFRLGNKMRIEKLGLDPVPVELYIPSRSFNGRMAGRDQSVIDFTQSDSFNSAMSLAEKYHPAWSNLKQYQKLLMGRNSMQVFGSSVNSPVRAVVCYTKDGSKGQKTTSKTGGSGQALRIAFDHNITVLNIGNTGDHKKLEQWINDRRAKIMFSCGVDIREAALSYIQDYVGLDNKNVLMGRDVFAPEKYPSKVDNYLVHGCNCFNTMGSGLAKQIKERYPESFLADKETVSGSKDKLGSFSLGLLGDKRDNLSGIINAYTQYRYGRKEDLYLDYRAVKQVFQSLNKEYSGSGLVVPRIGAGLAGGCWINTVDIMNRNAPDIQKTFFLDEFDRSPSVDHSMPRQDSLDL